jgi:uncharacterized protein involved in propanediol utilization
LSGSFGRGEAMGHAGEILQGIYLEEPFLVSLPAPNYISTVEVRSCSEWRIEPGGKTKALDAAKLVSAQPLSIRVASNIPVGRGCGSSTADCVAAIRAVAQLQNRKFTSGDIATLSVASEVASDSTMFDLEPVVFRQRSGKVLRSLGSHWPPLYVSVIDLGGPDVDTLTTSMPNYSSEEIEEFTHLLDQCSSAFAELNPELLGKVATQSAIIHQRHRPHPAWPSCLDFVRRMGAYGLARSHSGTVAAVLSARPMEGYETYTLGNLAKGI